jgi:hypothetical protein
VVKHEQTTYQQIEGVTIEQIVDQQIEGVTIEQIVDQQIEGVNVEQIANQQQRKGKSMLEDKKQVLGLWCVV